MIDKRLPYFTKEDGEYFIHIPLFGSESWFRQPLYDIHSIKFASSGLFHHWYGKPFNVQINLNSSGHRPLKLSGRFQARKLRSIFEELKRWQS